MVQRETRDMDISSSGLSVTFPEGVRCPGIASNFASPYRYDGSRRPMDRNGGLHGGMDLSLKEGTPLLALASGEIIAAGKGGQMEGNFLWLRMAPQDTGLPYWTFAKYQHLVTPPELQVGQRVSAGQVIAYSGATGTQGGHYGANGYPHLHLSTYFGPNPDFTVRGAFDSMVKAKDATPDDPLVFYLEPPQALDQVRQLPQGQQQVSPEVLLQEQALIAGTRRVWPVFCTKDKN